MRWRTSLVIVALAGLFVSAPGLASDSKELPQYVLQPVMKVSASSPLTPQQVALISAGVRTGGAKPHALSFPTFSLTAQTRQGKNILSLRDGWRIPMATKVAPFEFVRAIGGNAMAKILSRGEVLIGQTAAEVRGARIGDVLTLRDSKFLGHLFTIGAIIPDVFVDFGDLLMSRDSALSMGFMPVAQIAVTNIITPKAVLAGLKRHGITIGTTYRLRTSWDRANPDSTLGSAITKKMLGEFSFRPTTGSSILIAGAWTSKNIIWSVRYADSSLKNNCHQLVIPAVQGALSEIQKAGLAKFIDVQNTNRFGGCFLGRYNRLGGKFAPPSRHAWGMALDINTDTNPQRGIPQMNCDVVRIFRKWGFAWGGNFWPSDGMHFEYVGEPRDQLGYSSPFCPNKVPVPTTTLPIFGKPTTTLAS